jgi:hypothetical protein
MVEPCLTTPFLVRQTVVLACATRFASQVGEASHARVSAGFRRFINALFDRVPTKESDRFCSTVAQKPRTSIGARYNSWVERGNGRGGNNRGTAT